MDELDSIRGLAASTVLFSHLILVFNYFEGSNNILIKFLRDTPLHIVYAGHEAVILFFILSGFVLSLPFLKGQNVSYQSFLIKRIMRLYIPLLCMITITLLIREFLSRDNPNVLGAFLGRIWSNSLSLHDLLGHLSLIGFFDIFTLNPVIWSLVHEMRISLVLPFIVYMVIKINWKYSILIGLALSMLGFVLQVVFSGNYISIFNTVYFSFMFIVGSVLAKHLDNLIFLFNNQRKILQNLIWIIGVCLYTYPFWFMKYSPLFHKTIIDNWVTIVGSAILIIYAIASKGFSKVLRMKLLLFIGKSAYSLYLYHLVAILLMFHLFYNYLPNWIIVVLSIIVTILLTVISYYCIEKPTIKLGRMLTKKKKTMSNSSKIA